MTQPAFRTKAAWQDASDANAEGFAGLAQRGEWRCQGAGQEVDGETKDENDKRKTEAKELDANEQPIKKPAVPMRGRPEDWGCTRVKNRDRGNCFFHAVAQVTSVGATQQKTALETRAKVAGRLTKHSKNYEAFRVGKKPDQHEEHCSGDFGDNVDMCVFTKRSAG